jgi:hypothetical protein
VALEVWGARVVRAPSLALATAVHDVPARWNDAPGRHVEDVLDALGAALEHLRLASSEPFVGVD